MTSCDTTDDRASSCAKSEVNKASGGDGEANKTTTARDLSSVSVDHESETITIDVGAPGVRQQDLAVTALDDNVLSVKGETKDAAGVVFKVERLIQLPANADMSSLRATHADGKLTIFVPRKITRVNIPVHAATAPVEEAKAEAVEAAAPKEDGEEDEWEPLAR